MTKFVTNHLAIIARTTSYVFLLLQWLWVFLLYSSWAIESGALQSYLDVTQTSSSREPVRFDIPEFISQPLTLVVLVVVAILSVLLLVRTPKKATQMTIHATKATAKSITPRLQKMAHVPKKQTKQFAEKVLVGVITTVSVIACLLTIPILQWVSLPASVTLVVAIALSIVTIGLLLLSVLVSYLSGKQPRSSKRDV